MDAKTTIIEAIDSHTAGEPTRVVLDGGPDLGDGPLEVRLKRFARDFDHYRSAIVNEPRGSEALVGALLTPPHDPRAATGVIFFNNTGYLRMCGHGAMGVVVTLAHLGRIPAGSHLLDTPAGQVCATLHADGAVSIENVVSYRERAGIAVELSPGRTVHGDIVWGGNWFFVSSDHGEALEADRVTALTAFCWEIRRALERAGVTGRSGAKIDHILLLQEDHSQDVNSRNFVLCPGGAYDRSPCGTGTSAIVACLAAEEKLEPGQIWRQQGILGSVFEASYRMSEAGIVPFIRGKAWVTAETKLLLRDDDPLCWGRR